MYSNDLTQIRAGLVNYIGAALTAAPFEGKAARQMIVSILTEEALKLSQDKDGEPFDLYVIKPIIRSNILIFRQRIAELNKLPSSKDVQEAISSYTHVIQELEQLLSKL